MVGLIRGSSKTVSNSQILACELRNYTLPKSELQNGPVHFLPCPIPLRLSPFTFLYHLPSSHLPNSPASRPPPHCSIISPFLPNSAFKIPLHPNFPVPQHPGLPALLNYFSLPSEFRIPHSQFRIPIASQLPSLIASQPNCLPALNPLPYRIHLSVSFFIIWMCTKQY